MSREYQVDLEKNGGSVKVIEAQEDAPKRKKGRKSCRDGPAAWCRKYFWEGQELANEPKEEVSMEGKPWRTRFLHKYRRPIGFLIPAVTYHFFWYAIMIDRNLWYLFKEKYAMTITMIFGGTVAGMTSVGGGAIAFPVMTLVLNLTPSMARDFSMMIQGTGMSAATFSIFFQGVCVEWNSMIVCTFAGTGGIILGLYLVDPYLEPQHKKMGFVSIWFAFAIALLILNRAQKRKTFNAIQDMKPWKYVVLFIFGFIGGIFTSFAGTGMDICVFMVLTLLFRITEKVATPTSVIIMATNSLIGLYWRGVMFKNVLRETWEYLAVSGPIVVFMAPIGSTLGTHFHRIVLAALVIAINTASLIGGFVVVRPLSPGLIGVCVGIVAGCFVLFMLLTYAGGRMADAQVKREAEMEPTKEIEKNGIANEAYIPESSNSSHQDITNTSL